ncbi:MAG TPA: tetratricopeptide repeat protein [Pyrinomonadaceae bacterium]|jgi:tetratricopeptide (TPR) repeat protein
MFNSAVFTKTADKFIPFLCLALLPAVFAAFGGARSAAFGQPKLGDSVYKKQKSADDDKQRPSKKKTKPNVAKNNAAPAVKPAANRRTAPKTYLDVTFIAKEPAVEVYLNERNIGQTDDTFQLSKRLTPGEYLVMAKNKRRVLMTTRKVTISPEQTTVRLFDEIVPKPTPVVVEPVESKEKSEAEIALEISGKVKKVLENYGNPATTDTVTTDDWQMVFQAAQLGQLQGYTAVQIEAQRWFASGQIELAKGDYTNAFTAFNKAQEFMPTSALPFYALGNTYFANQKYPDALKLYQKALQVDPKLAVGYKKLGDTQRLLGREKEAIAAYKNAVRFGYKTLETRFWLGTLMLGTKQIEEAIKELEEVAKEMPKAEVFISIGNGYEKMKRDVSAIEAYQKAIDADPNSALAYSKLADVYQSQREYTKAKEAYEKALALDAEGKAVNKTEIQKKLKEASDKLNK